MIQSHPVSPPRPPPPHHANCKRSSCVARPIVSSLVESASAKPVRAKRASRPGNIEKRAGHGRESILWLIRASRERRKVTAKGNRSAQLPVDSEAFLRPVPAQASPSSGSNKQIAACFLHSPAGCLRRQPAARRSANPHRTLCVQPQCLLTGRLTPAPSTRPRQTARPAT